jgi:cathepsin C
MMGIQQAQLVWQLLLFGRQSTQVFVQADLPVHCLRHQVVGQWEFTMGPTSHQRSSCGHQRPDDESKQPEVLLQQISSVKRISLQDPNIAMSDGQTPGNWTMIYDEGFEVKVDGLSFFAFSNFDLKYDNDVKINTSHCDKTQLGWYHNADRTQWGCYYGKKIVSGSSLIGQRPPAAKTFAPGPSKKSAHYDELLDSLYHKRVAEQLNLIQEDWVAMAHGMLSGKSLRELNEMAGLRRNLPLSQLAMRSNQDVAFIQERRSILRHGQARKWDLPKAWNWQNVSGVNYLESVIDQGQCGSCYTVATTRMLTARHRIKQKDPTLEQFSIDFPLHCSEYNQGCQGGYAFLASKWSHDVGVVPESCAKYVAEGRCELSCDPEKLNDRHRADNYHYIGGYYGGANEADMLWELYHNGPVVVSFEPANDIMYYSGGIYRSKPQSHVEWEKVDHAVLLVGYGEENGKKYWVLQNSWGPDWGEKGFFRMIRGENDSGVESIAVAADVVKDQNPNVLLQFFSSQTI